MLKCKEILIVEESEAKETPIKWIVMGIVIGVVVVASLVILLTPSLNPLYSLMNPPKPEITSKSGQGVMYAYYVEATVRNNGGDGWIKVFAEVSGAGEYQKQDQRVHLASGESLDLIFTFYRDSPFSSISYRVWAVAD